MRVVLWRLTWGVGDEPGDFMPLNDAVGHTPGEGCICGPKLDPHPIDPIYRHVPLDVRREFAS